MNIQGVTHWSIPVKDLTESERFYRDILGLEYRGRLGNSGMACVVAGDSSILLCEEPGTVRPSGENWNGAGVHHSFHMSAPDWEEGVRRLHENNVQVLDLVYREKGHFPGREVYFLDPSGNVLELRDPSWTPGAPKPTLDEITAG